MEPGQGIVTFQAPLSPEIIHFSIVDATIPFDVPFVLPTEGLGIVETLQEHFEIMNLEVDIPEDYVGRLTGMDFAQCPTADSLTNVHNVERNIQCSSASQANIREITVQINQAKITVYNLSLPSATKLWLYFCKIMILQKQTI
jgi:hypothetical protein